MGLKKCAAMIIVKRGKTEEDDGATSPDGEMMKDSGQDDYKYQRDERERSEGTHQKDQNCCQCQR